MGQFLTILTRQKKVRSQLQFFHRHSLTKISEFYQQYKSISDTLAIDDSQFLQIFGQYLNVFQILDTDKNLLIDGLQLFSGLILYSKIIKFQNKIQFLFNLFDFNQQNSLFPNDLEFMFLSCCTFTHKIYGLRSQLNQVWIQQFVRSQFFNGQTKINISEIMKWAKQSAIITIFFQQILQRPIKDTSTVSDQRIYLKQKHVDLSEIDLVANMNDKIYESYLAKVKSRFQTIQQQKIEYSKCDVYFQTNWIYGFRFKDVKKVFQVVYDQRGNLQIVYFVGCICILYKPQSNSQRHYRSHSSPIISIGTNSKRYLMATSEYCQNPQIKIWSYKTLQTKLTIKTNHRYGVHLMNFTKDGKFLVSAGCGAQGSFNIHNAITGLIVYCLFCSTPIVDINQLTNYTTTFIKQSLMTGIYQVSRLTITNELYMEQLEKPTKSQVQIKQYIMQACQFQDGMPVSKITCSAFYYINRNFSYLNEYDQSFNKYILTGHQNGEVNVWNPQYQSLQFQLTQQKCQIIKLLLTKQYLIILSDSSYLIFYDICIQKKQRKKTIDITQISYHLHSYNIRDCVPLVSQQYLICTAKGDVFILGNQITKDQIVKLKLKEMDYEVNMIDEMFTLDGKIMTSSLLARNFNQNTQEIYYGGELGIIHTINTNTHKKTATWNIGQQIVHLDVGESKHHGVIIVAATQSNKIYMKVDNVESTQKIEIKDEIIFILLSQDNSMLIVSTSRYDQHNLLVFSLSSRLTFSLISTLPVQQKLIFLQSIQKKTLLAITHSNEQLLISLKDMHIKPLQSIQRSFSNPIIQLVYYLKQKSMYIPMVMGATSKIIAIGKENGTINVWRNAEELENGAKVKLLAHVGPCVKLDVSQDQKNMFSTGRNDNMIVNWTMRFFIQTNSALTSDLPKIQQIDDQIDQFLARQITFCTFNNNLLTELSDQHLFVRGIGSNNDTLSKLFKGMIQQWKILNKYPNIKQQPSLNLKLDFVLGMEVFNKTQTVISLRNRKIAYFVSKVIVIYDPNNNKQEIYTGHRFKVTCICKLQSPYSEKVQLLASSQCSYRPKINIWNSQSMQTLQQIETCHRWGIISLSIQGHCLLSYGLNDINPCPIFRLQLTSLSTLQCQSSLILKLPIYSMKINPLNQKRIVVAMGNSIVFYQNFYHYFKKVSTIYLEDQHVTTMIWYHINSKEVDLLVGTKKGSIATVVREKHFIVIKSRAHDARINCLLMMNIPITTNNVNSLNEIFFVTTSQDQTIKIWSKKFQMLYDKQMKKNQSDDIFKGNFGKTNDLSYNRNRAIQSMTIFDQRQLSPSLLLGTRNGDVFQLIVETDFVEKDPFRNSKYMLYIKTNIAQSSLQQTKKVLVSHHPKQDIIVTIGQDQNLLFWDTDGNRFIFSKYLGYSAMPTAMKFSRDGDYLIIGFNDGLLIFLDSKISKSLQGKTDQKYLMPSLSLVKKQKAEQNNPILNIELSDSGQHLAVSYNYRIQQSKQKKSLSSNSFITLLNNKNRDKMKNFSKLDSGKIFEKFTSITCPYAQSIYKTDKHNQYGMAAYSMTFAEGQGKVYLLIYYQLIDSAQNRLNFSTDGKYSVWDVSTSTMIANLDLISSLNWKKLCFQNSVFSKYTFYKEIIDYKGKMQDDEQPINSNLYIPHMTAIVNIPNHAIFGSVNGDLHIVKASALEFQGVNPSIQDMFIAKSYPGHCSEVNQVQINVEKMHLFTTSIGDQCIFKYKIEGSTKLNIEQQNENNQKDLFSQVPSVQHQQQMVKIYDQKQKLTSPSWSDANFQTKMSISQIIGRQSSKSRNNLFLDISGNIIYCISQSIIVYSQQTHQKKYIYLSSECYSHNEISQIRMTNDNLSMVVGYAGSRTQIVMWDNTCKSIAKRFFVNQLQRVLLMALNSNTTRLVLYGLDINNKAKLILINFQTCQPLAVVSYAHKAPWIIKAIQFADQSQSIFYTCGVEETRKWTYNGGHLTYQQILLDKADRNIHLCLAIINKQIITGTEDGTICVWKNDCIKRQQHDDIITCLSTNRSKKSSQFISGSKDGTIIMWTFENINLIMIKRISISSLISSIQKNTTTLNNLSNKQLLFNNEIQSVSFYNNDLVIGTRCGSIYKSNIQGLVKQIQEKPIQQVFEFHDFQTVQAMFFNPTQKQLYEISQNGLLNIWLHKKYKKIFSHNFQQQTVEMLYHQKSNTIFIAFKKQLRVFTLKKQQSSSQQLSNQQRSGPLTQIQNAYKLRQIGQLGISIKYISHILFSRNQKMIAIGIQSNSDSSICIQVYEIPELHDLTSQKKKLSNTKLPQQLKKLFKISLSSAIQFIDFSVQNKYILIKTKQSVLIRDMAQSKNINQQLISKIEWSGKGLVYCKQCQPILISWHQCNLLHQSSQATLPLKQQTQSVSIIRLQGQRFLVIEKYGAIYVFHKELLISRINVPISRVDHFALGKARNVLALGSKIDRMIVVVDISKCLLGFSRD